MTYLTTVADIQEIIADYSQAKTLWVDTEVADYDTKQARLSLIQVSDNSTNLTGDHVSILDVLDRPELIDEFINGIMFNPHIEKVFHNAKYDLQFLGKRKAENITCTLEMAQGIPYYLVSLPNFQLKTLAEQLCYFPTIDKSEQGGNWKQRPLTEKQLNYVAMDVVYTAQVHHRLLQISQQVNPNPEIEDINALMRRYREIENDWKCLDSEVNHIKDRLKAAMQVQNINEGSGFKLSTQTRNTKKVAFQELAKLTQHLDLELDLPITLTKSLQAELGNLLNQLPIEEKENTIYQLRVTKPDEDILF